MRTIDVDEAFPPDGNDPNDPRRMLRAYRADGDARFNWFTFSWAVVLWLGSSTSDDFARVVAGSMRDGWLPEGSS